MKLLQKVARAGNIVLFTIHQPSSDIFASFDRLILLSRGRLMYQGLIENINADFGQNGYPIPQNYNPADWVLVSENLPHRICRTIFLKVASLH
jgi:ABC-type multidrug transport system ATPase subunit